MGTQVLPRDFRVWVGAATLSEVGDAIVYFALGWAASGYGGGAAGLVLAGITVPRTVLMLVGGAVADRVGPRAVMLTADAVLLVGSVAAAVAVALVGTPLWLLLTVAVLIGVVTSFYFPASGSLPARLVPRDQLPRAMALNNAGVQFASVAGGPLGGPLVVVGGLMGALGANAVSFLLVLAVMLGLRPAVPGTVVARRPLLAEIGDGLRVAARVPALRVVLALYALAAGFFLPVSSLLVPLLGREQGWDAARTGFVDGAISVGALAGALVFSRTGTWRRVGLASGAGLVVMALGAVALAAVPSLGIAAGVATGGALAVFIAHAGPLIVSSTPDTHLSRVQALLGVVQSAALVGTNLLLGWVAHAGAGLALLVAAGVLGTTGVLAAVHPALRTARGSSGPR